MSFVIRLNFIQQCFSYLSMHASEPANFWKLSNHAIQLSNVKIVEDNGNKSVITNLETYIVKSLEKSNYNKLISGAHFSLSKNS